MRFRKKVFFDIILISSTLQVCSNKNTDSHSFCILEKSGGVCMVLINKIKTLESLWMHSVTFHRSEGGCPSRPPSNHSAPLHPD